MTEKRADARSYYSDIFTFPHWAPASRTSSGRLLHPRMPMEKRAAIFASFDALSGYKDLTVETARRTGRRIEPDETQKEKLDQSFSLLVRYMKDSRADAGAPPVSITYFVPDARKDGGEYHTRTGLLKKIDFYKRLIYLETTAEEPCEICIRFDDVIAVDSELISRAEL